MSNETTTVELRESQKANHWKIDPRSVKVKKGFNKRVDFGDLQELKNSIIEHGVKVPLQGFKNPDGEGYILKDGERRLRATMLAIEEGHEIARIPFIVVLPGTPAQDLLDSLILNDGKKFTPSEESMVFAQLQKFGWSPDEIAQKAARSISHVHNLLKFSTLPKDVQDKVNAGLIAISSVFKIQNENKDVAQVTEVVEQAVEKAKSEGKKKATAKHIESKPSVLSVNKNQERKEKCEQMVEMLNAAKMNMHNKDIDTAEDGIDEVILMLMNLK